MTALLAFSGNWAGLTTLHRIFGATERALSAHEMPWNFQHFLNLLIKALTGVWCVWAEHIPPSCPIGVEVLVLDMQSIPGIPAA